MTEITVDPYVNLDSVVPMKHHTKNKGDIGLLKAMCDLTVKGYVVLTSESEHLPFDLVIWKDGEFKTVQVKYRAMRKGRVEIHFKSSWADKHGSHDVPVDKSKIDLYCIYCPDNDTCYYLNPNDFDKTVTLRIEKSAYSSKRSNNAEDYLNP